MRYASHALHVAIYCPPFRAAVATDGTLMPWLEANCTAELSVDISDCSWPGADFAMYDALCAVCGFSPDCSSDDGFIWPMPPSPDCKLEYWLTPLPNDDNPSVNACLLTGRRRRRHRLLRLANAWVSVCDNDCCVLPTCVN